MVEETKVIIREEDLADDAVTTLKIPDNSVTIKKLSNEVQGMLGGGTVLYDYIVDSQSKLDALLASSTWLNAKNVLFAANVTVLDKQMLIPPTVERIDGINNATITFDLHYEIYSNDGNGYGYPVLSYAKKPTGSRYQINNLTIVVNFDDIELTLVKNCINLTNVTVKPGDRQGSYWVGFSNCDNMTNCIADFNMTSWSSYYAFYNCANLYNCTGVSISREDCSGGAFHDCYNLVNCTGDKRLLSPNDNNWREIAAFWNCSHMVNCTGTALRYNAENDHPYGWKNTNTAYVFWNCTDMVNCSQSNITADDMITDGVFYGDMDVQDRVTDLKSKVAYDYVVKGESDFYYLLSSPTWHGYKSILITTNVTLLEKKRIIPQTVERIDGINNATITIYANYGYLNTNEFYQGCYMEGENDHGAPAFGYAKKPSGSRYQMNNLNIEVNMNDSESVLVKNCINLTNVNISGGDNYGVGFDNCNNLKNCKASIYMTNSSSAFRNCNGLYDCIGKSISNEDSSGGAFENCTNLINCTGDKRLSSPYDANGREIAAFWRCSRMVNCIGTSLRENSAVNPDNKAYVFWNCTDIMNCSKSNETAADMITDEVYYGCIDIQKRVEDLSNYVGYTDGGILRAVKTVNNTAPDSNGNVNVSGVGKKYTTLVVGTTKAGHTASDVDFLCNGSSDQNTINNAINAIPSNGGEIIIREGIYYLDNSIVINNSNVTIRGMGSGTILHCLNLNNDDDYDFGYDAIVMSGSNNKIKGLHIRGKHVWSIACAIVASGSNNIIEENIVHDCGYNGAIVVGSNVSRNNSIKGNTIYNTLEQPIYIKGSDNIVSGNLCYDTEMNPGIVVDCNNSVISGNVCRDIQGEGIIVFGGNNTISVNVCINNVIGIRIDPTWWGGVVSKNNIITGNMCIRGDGLSGNYNDYQHTIFVGAGSSNNLIANNNIMGKNYTDESKNSSNTFVNNKYN